MRNFTCIAVLSLMLLAQGAHAEADEPTSTPTATPSAQDKRQAKDIDGFCKAIDKVLKKLPYRVYVDTGDMIKTADQWKMFKNSAEAQKLCDGNETCYTACTLYYRDHRPVLASFDFSSPSGDWVTYVDYYFRANGTVMKSHCDLRRFGAIAKEDLGKDDEEAFMVKVLEDIYYDPQGNPFHAGPPRYFNMDTKKEVPEPSYMGGEWPDYKKLSDLPFYSIIVDPR